MIGLLEAFQRYPLSDPGWFHNESDSGPGPATDPGRSLRWEKVSARYMLGLRRDHDRDDCDDRGRGHGRGRH